MIKINLDTYCPRLFSFFDTNKNGACCRIDEKFLRFNNFKEMIVDPEHKKLTADLALFGKKNEACAGCWYEESLGVYSLRRQALDFFTNNQKEFPRENKLIFLTIDTGNNCNLACRTCAPSVSSGWWKETNTFDKNQNWGSSSIRELNLAYWLLEDLSNVEKILVLGGEPFLDTKHLTLLEEVFRQRGNSNVQVHYVTNATIKLSSRHKEVLSKIPKLQIGLSIDAIEDRFHYIRTGGCWEDVLENIKDYRTLNSTVKIGVNVTVSIYNVLYLNEVFNWALDNNFILDFMFAYTPFNVSFKTLDTDRKNKVIEKLQQSNHDMTAIIQHINDSEYSNSSYMEFINQTVRTEKFRKLKLSDYLPELNSLMFS